MKTYIIILILLSTFKSNGQSNDQILAPDSSMIKVRLYQLISNKPLKKTNLIITDTSEIQIIAAIDENPIKEWLSIENNKLKSHEDFRDCYLIYIVNTSPIDTFMVTFVHSYFYIQQEAKNLLGLATNRRTVYSDM
jgi:hypothetical protein